MRYRKFQGEHVGVPNGEFFLKNLIFSGHHQDMAIKELRKKDFDLKNVGFRQTIPRGRSWKSTEESTDVAHVSVFSNGKEYRVMVTPDIQKGNDLYQVFEAEWRP